MLSNFSFLLFFEYFQALNLHHQIKLLLLLDVLCLKFFILLELFVSNGDNLRVQDHLVHVLNVIEIIIHFLLSLRSEIVVLGGLAFLPLSWLNFFSSFGIHFEHLSFFSL